MHARRVVSTLLGCWIGGSLFMIWVATQNFRGVERVLAAPPAAVSELLRLHGAETVRLILRHLASELNRFYFAHWELVQLGLGLLLALLLFRQLPALRWMAWASAALTVLTAVEHWLITPETIRLGRIIEFATGPSPERERFWTLHTAYSTIEVIRVIALVAMTWRLWRPSRQVNGDERD